MQYGLTVDPLFCMLGHLSHDIYAQLLAHLHLTSAKRQSTKSHATCVSATPLAVRHGFVWQTGVECVPRLLTFL